MGVDINICKFDHICCFKCHVDNREMKMQKTNESVDRQKKLENENKLMRAREKDIIEKVKELNQREENINKKFFDLKEKEREREKEVFRTDNLKLNYENDKVKKTINASRDYNYKGEVLNQRVEKTFLQKENPNNYYLGNSNNNRRNISTLNPNYLNKNNSGNIFDQYAAEQQKYSQYPNYFNKNSGNFFDQFAAKKYHQNY